MPLGDGNLICGLALQVPPQIRSFVRQKRNMETLQQDLEHCLVARISFGHRLEKEHVSRLIHLPANHVYSQTTFRAHEFEVWFGVTAPSADSFGHRLENEHVWKRNNGSFPGPKVSFGRVTPNHK